MLAKILLSATLFFIVTASTAVIAADHSAFCTGSDSTAATAKCLNRHLGWAQNRLNKSYEKLSAALEGENLESLRVLQKDWLAYRDGQCEWESRQTEVSSLERVNKLSCLARMSEDRADLLAAMIVDEEMEGYAQKFGGFPRWMNVLAKDKPEVFWSYGKRLRADLDCDSENEMVFTGLLAGELDDVSTGEGEKGPKAHGLTLMLAIAENPPTGRPQTYILPFVVGTDICSASASLSVQEEISEEGDSSSQEAKEEPEENKKCGARLTLAPKGCDPVSVIWSGKTYEIEPEEIPEEKTTEEKTRKEK